MPLQLIQQYYTRVDKIIQYGGSHNESSLRFAFQTLLEQYCADKSLELIAELEYKTSFGTTVYPDGTLKDAMRQDWGYWESKDQFDTLDEEIQKKFDKGYPQTNILFEDSQTVILIQSGQEVARVESVAEYKAGGGSRFRAAFLLAAEPGVSGVVASANRRSGV